MLILYLGVTMVEKNMLSKKKGTEAVIVEGCAPEFALPLHHDEQKRAPYIWL